MKTKKTEVRVKRERQLVFEVQSAVLVIASEEKDARKRTKGTVGTTSVHIRTDIHS